MPSDRGYVGMLRSYQPYGAPSYSDYGDPRTGYSIGDLLGRQGQLEGARRAAGGQMLAHGFQQAFQGLGDYFTQREEKKQQAKREEATLAAIQSWDGKNPMELFAGMQKIRGPAGDALGYTNAVLNLRKGPQQDPTQELERFGKTAQFISGLDDATMATAWPAIRQSLGPTAARLGLEAGEEWDPKYRGIIAKAGEVFGPKKEARKLQTLSQGQVAFDEATGEIVARGPEKPQEKKVHTLSPGGMMVDESGNVLARAPRAPSEPKLERIETVGPDGKTMVQFVQPRAGASYETPAKAAPQQRLTKDEREHFAGISYAMPKMQAFADYVQKNPGQYGKWDAFRTGLQQAVPGLSAGEYATQDAFIGRLNAEIRHALYGANLTEGEKESAKSFMIDKSDQPAVILAKLKEVQGRAQSDMEYYRGLGFTLPESGPSMGGPGGNVVRVQSAADYAKIPSGTVYIAPNGKTMRKR